MKTVNLDENIFEDKIEYDWHELSLSERLKIAIGVLLGSKIVIYGKLKINTKNETSKNKK